LKNLKIFSEETLAKIESKLEYEEAKNKIKVATCKKQKKLPKTININK
jgi:hypothetical protein